MSPIPKSQTPHGADSAPISNEQRLADAAQQLERYLPNAVVPALNTLAESRDGKWIPALMVKIADPFPEIRLACATALSACGEPRWQKLVAGDLSDFERLAMEGIAGAVKMMVGLLSASYDVREQTARALQRIGNAKPQVLRDDWRKIHALITQPRKVETMVNRMSYDESETATSDTGIGLDFPETYPGPKP